MRSARRPTFGLVAGWLFLAFWAAACGDTTGTPLIAADLGPGLSPDPPPGDDGQLATGPVLGLCDFCEESEQCGDGNDYCLQNRGDPQLFCARDCQEGRGCPDGYECVGLANSSSTQCVPENRNCEHRASVVVPPRLAELRAASLEQLNLDRQGLGLPPLAPDECLNEIAQTSSREYALNGQRGTKYARECEPDLPNCACGWIAEHQVATSEYALVWTRAVSTALELGFATGAGSSTAVLATTGATRVGIGILLGGDEAWISFALGE